MKRYLKKNKLPIERLVMYITTKKKFRCVVLYMV